MLAGRRILLVIGGGIAAYKSLDLIRRLRERGAAVVCVMTVGAQRFVTPLAAAALTGSRVHTDLFDRDSEAEIGHIRLAREADAIVLAPATADLMARMAGGHASDLATAVLLATRLPVLVAPAMNPAMWSHPATTRNVATLRADGIAFVGPASGRMAEPEIGTGRMAEPVEIADAVEALLAGRPYAAPSPSPEGEVAGEKRLTEGETPAGYPHPGSAPPTRPSPPGRENAGPFAGIRVLVTSGPTHEAIDPVRYIANRSSGRQGHAIAAAFAAAGAEVTLVSGPVTLPDPAGVATIHVESARDMLAAVEAALPVEIAVFAAAVADWRAADAAPEKLKKDGGAIPPLRLTENPDILSTVAHLTAGRPRLVVGFAAETENVVANARAKLARKGCDIILANDVAPATGVFGGERNTVHLVSAESAGGAAGISVETWPTLDKGEVAHRLVDRIGALIEARDGPAAV